MSQLVISADYPMISKRNICFLPHLEKMHLPVLRLEINGVFFPSASVGWVMSDESFMQNIKPIDNLKWRISYGQTGNNAIGLYDAYGKYSTNAKYDGVAGIIRLLCLI